MSTVYWAERSIGKENKSSSSQSKLNKNEYDSPSCLYELVSIFSLYIVEKE